MREGNNLRLFVCPHEGGGGLPEAGPDRGVPQPGLDGRVSWPGQDGVYPSQVQMGGGYPNQGCSTPHPGLRYLQSRDGVPSRIGQQMEYLMRDGQYASCVYAWELSCLEINQVLKRKIWLCLLFLPFTLKRREILPQ